MSIVKSRRHLSDLKVLNAAYDLADYTVDKITDTDKFPKSSRFAYCQKMSELCLEISSSIKRANAVHVDEKHGDPVKQLRKRLGLQSDAFEACEALFEFIERAYVHLPLSGREADYWTGLVVNVEVLLESWRKSDIEAFKKKYMNNQVVR